MEMWRLVRPGAVLTTEAALADLLSRGGVKDAAVTAVPGALAVVIAHGQYCPSMVISPRGGMLG
jgi:hypothetical protein